MSSKKKRILVVDDDPLSRRMAIQMLKWNYYCTVTTVNSATEAFDVIKKLSPNWAFFGFDLILMDIYLPDLNGDELTDLLKKTEPQVKNSPIVAVTTETSIVRKEQFLAKGMSDLIIKPLTIEKFNAIASMYKIHRRKASFLIQRSLNDNKNRKDKKVTNK